MFFMFRYSLTDKEQDNSLDGYAVEMDDAEL